MTPPTTAAADLRSITGWQAIATDRDISLCAMYDEIGFQKLAAGRQLDTQADPGGIEQRTYRKDDGTLKTADIYHEPETNRPIDRLERLMSHVNRVLHYFCVGWVAADGTWLEPEGPPTMAQVRKLTRRGHGRRPITHEMQCSELQVFIALSREWLTRVDRADMRLMDARIQCELGIQSAETKLRQMQAA